MKRAFFIILILSTTTFAFAQRFAFCDTQYILSNIPDYKNAQQQLDALSTQWQKEIDDKNKGVQLMVQQFQSEEVLLTDSMKTQRQHAINEKMDEVKDLQKQRFGFDGDLFKKRQELVKPIQDKVFDAVQKIAVQKGYDFIFDKASANGVSMLYANSHYDVSDLILQSMGYGGTKTPAKTNK
jgi:outer membrane protein